MHNGAGADPSRLGDVAHGRVLVPQGHDARARGLQHLRAPRDLAYPNSRWHRLTLLCSCLAHAPKERLVFQSNVRYILWDGVLVVQGNGGVCPCAALKDMTERRRPWCRRRHLATRASDETVSSSAPAKPTGPGRKGQTPCAPPARPCGGRAGGRHAPPGSTPSRGTIFPPSPPG